MAVVTIVGADNMAVTFTGNRFAVMTGRAPAESQVMIEFGIGPAIGRVTITAGIGCGNVILVFARGHSVIVTGFAFPGCALEHPANMTAFTFNPLMQAGKIITGRQMFGHAH